MFSIVRLTTVEEMLVHHELLQQSYPDMSRARYERLLNDMLPNGYGQIAVLEKDLCLAVAGFWINTRIYCGKYIDIDNVVVREGYRSRGIGKLVTDWLEELGRNEGCGYSILDAYVENSKAHKFYFREGYMIRGFHFLKKLKDQV